MSDNHKVTSDGTDIYDPAFVSGLFTEMSATYGTVNMISSFGFARRWRKQCISAAGINSGATVADFMSGMGELWPDIKRQVGSNGKVMAVEFCPAMCERSRKTAHGRHVEILQVDALNNGMENECVDFVVSSFGLKTFSEAQKERLAHEIARVLKPGGQFSLIEISVPESTFLRGLYMFYLKQVIPLVGKLFMGNPDNYRMLGVYTQAFGNSSSMHKFLQQSGLNAHYQRYFFGCASGVVGTKN